jgi:hypothetical protein
MVISADNIYATFSDYSRIYWCNEIISGVVVPEKLKSLLFVDAMCLFCLPAIIKSGCDGCSLTGPLLSFSGHFEYILQDL